jgi:hypothetical protein
MLQEAGFPVDDVQQEIERIQSRQFDKARALADATGDTQLVADYLGVQAPAQSPAPAPQLPPAPGDQQPTDAAGAAAQGSGGNTA